MECKELENELFNAEIEHVSYYDRENKRHTLQWEIVDNEKFYNNFKELFNTSFEEDYYWFYCSFSTYKNTFIDRFEFYKNDFCDAELIDFVKFEKNNINSFVSYYNLHDINNINNEELFSDFLMDFSISHSSARNLPLNFYRNKELKKKVVMATIKKIEYLNQKCEKRENEIPEKDTVMIGNDITLDKSNQLTVNQFVLLLEEVGFFTGKISNSTMEGKAKLVALLTGRNHKNIKTSIEKLGKKPSELGVGHQKDIDKIKSILNSME